MPVQLIGTGHTEASDETVFHQLIGYDVDDDVVYVGIDAALTLRLSSDGHTHVDCDGRRAW